MDDVGIHAAAMAAGVEADDVEVIHCTTTAIQGSTGAATAGVDRLTGRIRVGSTELPFSMIRKTVRPVTEGRHAAAAMEATHWAYWRREPLAYQMGLVPAGPHLTAPRCFAVTQDAMYLADVSAPAESVTVAAYRLAAWQATTAVPQVPWLGGHQLAQRIAVSSLDWSAVDAPYALAQLWDRRDELLSTLDAVPVVVSHGDFHIRNLLAGGNVTTVLDWGTLSACPLGADLAHLALSTGEDPLGAYLAGLGDRFDPALAARAYRLTAALTATSRVHWMLLRGLPAPAAYVDLVGTTLERLSSGAGDGVSRWMS